MEMEVWEMYRSYRPPFDAARLVRRLLRTVPSGDLEGLSHVILSNARMAHCHLGDSYRTTNEEQRVLGTYHPWRRNKPAYIDLRVDAISSVLNSVLIRIPMLREVAFGYVLFHEIGHHRQLRHHLVRPDLVVSEGFADGFSHQFMTEAPRQHPWYARPLWMLAIETYWFMRRKRAKAMRRLLKGKQSDEQPAVN